MPQAPPEKAPESYLPQFGLDSFRPGQRDVVMAILEGHDCMCIMPTGGGKSLCYQLPAVMRPGLTLVVSPLIALMKDQVDSLRQRGIRAEFINSSLDFSAQQERLMRLGAGEFDLFYIAPERFRSRPFLDELRRHPINLLAVDEAHCISEWGHDFRHDYTRLGEYRERLGNPQTIALTATATADVRMDIVQQLRLKEPSTFVAGFARPNLNLEVVQVGSDPDKDRFLASFVRSTRGSGIIYAATRKACDSLCTYLKAVDSRSIAVYHGGLEMDVRRRTQEAFMAGDVELVVATNAFGMGIDKAEVRFVIHYNFPGSVEAYYQEAGRAGRDGETSHCVMLYLPSDARIQKFFIESAYPEPNVVRQVFEFLLTQEKDPIELTQQEIKDALRLQISSEGVGTCERLLEKCYVIERLEPNRNMGILRLSSDAPTLVDFLPKQATAQRETLRHIERIVGNRRFEEVFFRPDTLAKQMGVSGTALTRQLRELMKLDAVDYVPPFRGRAIRVKRRDLAFHQLDLDFKGLMARKEADYAKLDEVIRLATTRRCRQRFVMEYFGDPAASNCGHCDQCTRGSSRPTHGNLAEQVKRSILPSESSVATEVVLKALSGVARARERVGKNLIAGMLVGSKSERVLRAGLAGLSTFGVLKGWSQLDAIHLLDAILAAGWLKQVEIEPFRPILQLTETGRDVMIGQRPPDAPLELPADVLARVEKVSSEPPPHHLRMDAPMEPNRAPVNAAESAVGVARPAYAWSWQLLKDGYSAEECQEIRRLTRDMLLEHALEAHRAGLPVELPWLFTDIQLEILRGKSNPSETGKGRKKRDITPPHPTADAWVATPTERELFRIVEGYDSIRPSRRRRPAAGSPLE
jgi:ATP-dependent DNA helicase RecQ